MRGIADGIHELTVRGVFEHVADSSGCDRLAREGRVFSHRENHNRRTGRRLEKVRNRRHGAGARHVEVEYHHGRPVLARLSQRGVDVARLSDHFEVGLGIEQQPESGAHHRVVVGEHDLDRLESDLSGVRHDEANCTPGWPWTAGNHGLTAGFRADGTAPAGP